MSVPYPTDSVLSNSDEERLVAYLDDEMATAEKREFEDRLAQEPVLRQQLHELEETWQTLQLLETEGTNRGLILSTMELAAVRQSDRQTAVLSPTPDITLKPKTRLANSTLLVAGLFCFFMIGYVLTGLFFSVDERQKYDDLLIIEQLDQY
ncbi:MAG: anti-sigma factor family protein, partial [Thermoguttaceae bacterium]